MPVFFIRLSDDEQLCEEVTDTARMEALGNVEETCPPLRLEAPSQLVAMRARRYHLGADEAELRAWLAPHAERPILYFGRMFRRFRRFASVGSQEAFDRRYAAGVQPSPAIKDAADRALKALRALVGGDGHFDCVHMRRRDFVADHVEEESVEDYAARAVAKLQRRGSSGISGRGGNGRRHKQRGPHPSHGGFSRREAKAQIQQQQLQQQQPQQPPVLYLSSDVGEELATQEAFRRHFGRVFTLQSVFPRDILDSFTTARELSRLNTSALSAALGREMRFGNVDQLVCAASQRFVGNKWSSFTHHVCYLRQQLGVSGACEGSDIYNRDIDPDMAYV